MLYTAITRTKFQFVILINEELKDEFICDQKNYDINENNTNDQKILNLNQIYEVLKTFKCIQDSKEMVKIKNAGYNINDFYNCLFSDKMTWLRIKIKRVWYYNKDENKNRNKCILQKCGDFEDILDEFKNLYSEVY